MEVNRIPQFVLCAFQVTTLLCYFFCMMLLRIWYCASGLSRTACVFISFHIFIIPHCLHYFKYFRCRFVLDEYIYVLSYDGSIIYRMNKAGDYIDTIANYRDLFNEETSWSVISFLTSDINENIYSTNRNEGIVFKVTKIET